MTHELGRWPYVDMAILPVEQLGQAQRINRALTSLQAIDACLLDEADKETGQPIRHKFGLGLALYTSAEYYSDNVERQLTISGRLFRVFPDLVTLSTGPTSLVFTRWQNSGETSRPVSTYSTLNMLESGVPTGFEALAEKIRGHYVDQHVREAVEDTMPLM